MNLIDQLRHWPHGVAVVLDWLGKGGEIVSQDKAEARAAKCLTCPKHDANTPLARPVAMGVNEILSVLNKADVKLRMETKPNQCSVCGCDLQTKVWETLDNVIKHSTVGEMEDYWKDCWIVTEPK